VQKLNQIKIKFQDEVLEFELDSEKKIAVIQTNIYDDWIDSIIDIRTNARITKDVGKMRRGNLGNWKSVGEEVFETRLDYGPGYRIYYAKVGRIIVVLLGGGDKSTQKADIWKAQKLWKELKNEITQI
jgi:putative addiction module killer protein